MQLGKYHLVQKLASGGMAEVFLAKAAGPMGFEKILVVKRILPHLAEESAFVDMFLSEARLAAQLNHPNIIQIFDFGEAEGSYFLAMEYIDGLNLRVVLKRANAAGMVLQPTLCCRLITLACEGLAFAHTFRDPATGQSLGLVHRDISPDNIMVSKQGALKVVDFGIAKAAGQSHKTQTGVVRGKLTYMPPEQLKHVPLDCRADVYALGMVFYELLTGRKPFDATTEASIVQSILFEPLIPAVERRPDLPEAIQHILERALAKERDRRYPDCRAFQTDLERFIQSQGEPIGAWQLAQFIEQMASQRDAPALVSAPAPRSPSSKHPTVTVRPPPPPVEALSMNRPVTMPISITRTEELPHSPSSAPTPLPPGAATTAPAPAPGQKGPVSTPPSAPKWRKGLIPAAVGAALLVLGGGYTMAQFASGPSAPPTVAVPSSPEAPAPSQEALAPKAPDPAEEFQEAEEHLVPSIPMASEPQSPPAGAGPAPTPTPPPRVVTNKGTVEFRVRPYATVILDGKKLGDTPMDPISLPEGRYTVRFVNRELGADETKSFEVKAGKVEVVRATLKSSRPQ